MRTEELIETLSGISKNNPAEFERLRAGIPLGVDSFGGVAVSHRENKIERYHHTCVSGAYKTEFIKRLVLSLACLYERGEAAFLIVSPFLTYGELMNLKNADVTVPFIRGGEDLKQVLDCLQGLVRTRGEGTPAPKLFVVLDGIETLTEGDTALVSYRPFLDTVGTTGIEIISGVELQKSVFGGYPGGFVGVGNCLVTTDAEGTADLTYVNLDTSMSLPKTVSYPSLPSVSESIAFFNGIE
ncbi:MAG: hypothetical protein IJX81_03285 [Clostridia bacterium]|nr:hypothetical protein [Clostridia bacterium]